MRILLMADYKGGYEITKFLKQQGENIVGLVVHPPCMEKFLNKGYTKKIIEEVNLPEDKVFIWTDVKSGEALENIRALKPDLILTMFCCGILKPEVIGIASIGCINIHLAYLPYNRGKNPNVWAIIEGTPAGVTIHWIDEKIDTGEIISQTKIPVRSIDTAETIYFNSEDAGIQLFKDTWPMIKNGTAPRIKQDNDKATFRYAREFKTLNEINLNKNYTGRELIDVLRARTFPPHPGAYFIDDEGKKVHITVQLKYGDVEEKI